MGKKRAVEEVDSWNGAASAFDSTADYCKSCLIDVNSAAGKTEKAQSHCMLPVKMPGSSMMADKALHAAAGGRGLGAVKKPSDVPQSAWDAAIKKAANAIISGYKMMDEVAPDAIYEAAGKTPPEERSLMLDQVYQQLYEWGYEDSTRPYFTTFYLEEGTLYGLFNDHGQMYRAGIDVEADGQTLIVGELEPVIHEFTPMSRSAFFTVRQKDGNVRFFMVAATAIINRVAEIDSTKLFDDMISRAKEHDYYPKLDFFHLGSVDPAFEFGQFDYLARGGIAYIGSGLLDKGHPLSNATEREVKKNPDYWGASIEYYRPENRGMEYVEIGKGLEIAVFTEGLNTRISLLPEEFAANWYTGVTVEGKMDSKTVRALFGEKELAALRSLFGDDEKAFDAFLAKIKGINTDVETRNLVTRSDKDKETPTDKEEETDKKKADAPVSPVVELDDVVIAEVVKTARAEMETGIFATVSTDIQKMTVILDNLTKSQEAFLKTLNVTVDRVASLEATEEEKQREWMADLPPAQSIRVTHRPRQQSVTEPVEKTFAEQAATVLNSLPKVGVR